LNSICLLGGGGDVPMALRFLCGYADYFFEMAEKLEREVSICVPIPLRPKEQSPIDDSQSGGGNLTLKKLWDAAREFFVRDVEFPVTMTLTPFELPYQTGRDTYSKVNLPGCRQLITLDSGTDSLDRTAISVMGQLRPFGSDWRPPRDAWTARSETNLTRKEKENKFNDFQI